MKNVKRVTWLLIAILLIIGVAQPTRQTQAAVGFHISGRNLLDANGNNFIMRGIAHAHTWYPSQTSSFANIKAKGANTVRVVLSGGRWTANSASDVANVISLCKTNKLICVLEDHDTTGYGEDGAAYTLAQAVSYWKSIQSVLTGQEAYVIINIGNEPYGNNNAANWVNDTKNAIAAMRSAGFQHTLMVDAPNWGQDWQFVMRDNAASIFASDSARNTILSIHMYGVFDTAAEIQSYISTFVNAGLPLAIGEFGNQHSDGNPDEDTIMSQAQSNGIGYIGWSWSGNGGGVEYLDMVTNFDPNQVTAWGTRIISGANGIQQTSREASVYGGGGGATNTPIRTSTRTATRTNTPGGPTATRTRTPTRTPTGSCIPPTAEALRVSPVTSPVSATTQVITVTLNNGSSVTVTSEAGSFTSTTPSNGVFSVTINLVQNSTNHLQVQGTVTWSQTCSPYTLSTTVDTSGNPLTIVQGTVGPATNTPTRTRTPTRTNTPGGPTPTRTPTSGGGGGTACSPVNATITAPFVKDGAGTFCWRSNNLGSYINSWNLGTLTVNGVSFTNKFAFTTGPNTPTLPSKMSDGYWYINYVGNYAWSHFEAK